MTITLKQNKSEFKQLRCETQSSDKGNIPLWILTGDVSVSQCHSVSLSLAHLWQFSF